MIGFLLEWKLAPLHIWRNLSLQVHLISKKISDMRYTFKWLNLFPIKKIMNNIYLRLSSSWYILHSPWNETFKISLSLLILKRRNLDLTLLVVFECWVRTNNITYCCSFVLLLVLGLVKWPYFITHQMRNPNFRKPGKTTLESFFFSIYWKKIQRMRLKSLVMGRNAQTCLIALISDLVIGYHVSCHVAGSFHWEHIYIPILSLPLKHCHSFWWQFMHNIIALGCN